MEKTHVNYERVTKGRRTQGVRQGAGSAEKRGARGEPGEEERSAAEGGRAGQGPARTRAWREPRGPARKPEAKRRSGQRGPEGWGLGVGRGEPGLPGPTRPSPRPAADPKGTGKPPEILKM